MSLKESAFIDLEETADWLKIALKTVGLEGDTKAAKIIQDLTYTSKLNGTLGNDILIEYTSGAVAGSEVVTVTGNLVSVQIEDGVSTADQIKDAIDASSFALALVSVSVSGTGSNPQYIASVQALSGGAYAGTYDARLVKVLEKLINASCEKIEAIIDTPVLARTFMENHDGSESNVIKPHHWPVREITSLKIDYNRAFGSTSVIPEAQYFIRGGSDKRQTTDSPEIIVGNDIVLRDDNETFILGRIFSGSVVGSIQLEYTAGWGTSKDDIPQDLRMAALQLVEYWYLQRENRDINLSSKGVKGESYSKLKDGIPEQIYEIVEQYQDISFGTRPVPQRNYYRL